MSDEIRISKSAVNDRFEKINSVLVAILPPLNLLSFFAIAYGIVSIADFVGRATVGTLLTGILVAGVWCGVVATILNIRSRTERLVRQAEEIAAFIADSDARVR